MSKTPDLQEMQISSSSIESVGDIVDLPEIEAEVSAISVPIEEFMNISVPTTEDEQYADSCRNSKKNSLTDENKSS